MFFTFSEFMAHKHNKDADGSRHNPMSGHYSCKAVTGKCWMDTLQRRHAWKHIIIFPKRQRVVDTADVD